MIRRFIASLFCRPDFAILSAVPIGPHTIDSQGRHVTRSTVSTPRTAGIAISEKTAWTFRGREPFNVLSMERSEIERWDTI
jgi:hypothetical protein